MQKKLQNKRSRIRTRVTIDSKGEQMASDLDKYGLFDKPEITRFLFHPRSESGYESDDQRYQVLNIPVDEGVNIGGRFYASQRMAPVLMFFHGNGEIVADYDDIAQFYQRMNINFLAVDYRGYGISTGSPTVSSMMQDSHSIFKFVKDYLKQNGNNGALVLMGRSLGSASVLELASSYPDQIDGLIVESGFAFALPLFRLLGIDMERLGIEEDPIANNNKISKYEGPTLIIHAELDHIIPFSDGQELFEKAADSEKKILEIPGANHNDILARGLELYMKEVKLLIERALKNHSMNERKKH